MIDQGRDTNLFCIFVGEVLELVSRTSLPGLDGHREVDHAAIISQDLPEDFYLLIILREQFEDVGLVWS